MRETQKCVSFYLFCISPLYFNHGYAEDVARLVQLVQRPLGDRVVYQDDHQRSIGRCVLLPLSAYAGADIHVVDIDVRPAQHSPDAPDHTGLIVVAAEKNVPLRHKFGPVATNAHDTWGIVEHSAAEHLDALVARARLAGER